MRMAGLSDDALIDAQVPGERIAYLHHGVTHARMSATHMQLMHSPWVAVQLLQRGVPPYYHPSTWWSIDVQPARGIETSPHMRQV